MGDVLGGLKIKTEHPKFLSYLRYTGLLGSCSVLKVPKIEAGSPSLGLL